MTSFDKNRSLPQYRHHSMDLLVSVLAFSEKCMASQVMLLMYIAAVTGMELIKVDPDLPTEHPCRSLNSRDHFLFSGTMQLRPSVFETPWTQSSLSCKCSESWIESFGWLF